MNNILTIVEHDKIRISDKRDIEQKIISDRDSKLLLKITHKTKSGKIVKVFSHLGDDIQSKLYRWFYIPKKWVNSRNTTKIC